MKPQHRRLSADLSDLGAEAARLLRDAGKKLFDHRAVLDRLRFGFKPGFARRFRLSKLAGSNSAMVKVVFRPSGLQMWTGVSGSAN